MSGQKEVRLKESEILIFSTLIEKQFNRSVSDSAGNPAGAPGMWPRAEGLRPRLWVAQPLAPCKLPVRLHLRGDLPGVLPGARHVSV